MLILSNLQQTLEERTREHELSRRFLLLVIAVERHLDIRVVQVDDVPISEGLVEHGITRFQLIQLFLRYGRFGFRLLRVLLGVIAQPPGGFPARRASAAQTQLEGRVC